MQSLALIVGMSGGFVGIYLALLLVIATGLFGAVATLAGSRTAVEPLYWGLGALASYTLGVIGGTLAPHRPGQAAALMFIAAVAGLIATLMVGPSATNVLSPSGSSSPTPRTSAAPSAGAGTDLLFLVPFAAPLLLVIGVPSRCWSETTSCEATRDFATSADAGAERIGGVREARALRRTACWGRS